MRVTLNEIFKQVIDLAHGKTFNQKFEFEYYVAETIANRIIYELELENKKVQMSAHSHSYKNGFQRCLEKLKNSKKGTKDEGVG